MAMTGTSLRDRIDSELDTLIGEDWTNAPTDVKNGLLKGYLAIANAVVAEIQNNAQVTTSVTVASVSGVTTGPGVSGPGSGTGSGGVL